MDASGARRVVLSWGAAADDSGRVAYQVERDGVAITGLLTETTYEDRNVAPGKTYKYDVLAADIPGNKSPKVSVDTTTVAEVPDPGFLLADVYTNITGTPVDNLLADPNYPASPAFSRYVNGLSYGEPAFGDTYGENIGVRIAGVLTAPETGNFYFHVRSDDASRFYIDLSGAAIPDPNAVAHVAEETGCCTAFLDSGDESVSAEATPLTAGRQYGVLFLVKEGGGGDWGQVGWSKTGLGADARVIQGAYLQGVGLPVGAVVLRSRPTRLITTAAYKSATFSVSATTASPYTSTVLYQSSDGTLIAGANSSSYTLAVAQPADNGAKIKCLVAVPARM